ncbi:hypothetical protein GGI24_004533 [Coemansia furcata]|nr:hypothetical protein GGI24_004533 [Coemansia furcata]
MALLYSFDQIASHIAQVGLVVVNTISWPFLASFTGNIARRQVLHAELAHLLSQIASKHKVAIVLVSQAKSAFGRSNTPSPSSMDGDVWTRVAANRMSLQRRPDGGFKIALTASTMHPSGEAFINDI